MSDKFKLLLKQIHFPQHEEAYNEIKSGSIESVKLFKSKRQWFFVFSCLLYTSPSPRDRQKTRMPSSA